MLFQWRVLLLLPIAAHLLTAELSYAARSRSEARLREKKRSERISSRRVLWQVREAAEKKQRLKALILEELEPLFTEAEKEGLWFKSTNDFYLWLSPAELREAHAEGRFVLGSANWTLQPPEEYLADARVTLQMFRDVLELMEKSQSATQQMLIYERSMVAFAEKDLKAAEDRVAAWKETR